MAEGDAYGIRSALQAAKDLRNYLSQKGVALGSKGAPVPFIAAAQADMGGGLATDGIMGPKTRARMNDLLSGRVSAPNIAAAAMVAPPQPAAAVLPPVPPPPPPQPVYEYAPTVEVAPVVVAEPEPPPAPVYTPEVVNAVATIPTEDRSAMATALTTFAAQPSGTMADYDALISALSSKFTPMIQAISDEVNMQAIQRQATSEHNTLLKQDEYQSKNNEVLQRIVDKFDQLQKLLMANNTVSKKVYQVYGVHL